MDDTALKAALAPARRLSRPPPSFQTVLHRRKPRRFLGLAPVLVGAGGVFAAAALVVFTTQAPTATTEPPGLQIAFDAPLKTDWLLAEPSNGFGSDTLLRTTEPQWLETDSLLLQTGYRPDSPLNERPIK